MVRGVGSGTPGVVVRGPVQERPAPVQKAEHRRYGADDPRPGVCRHQPPFVHRGQLRPVGGGAEVVFLVVAVVEGEHVVQAAVVAHRVRRTTTRVGAVMPVVVLYVNEHERREERREVAEHRPLPRQHRESGQGQAVRRAVGLHLAQFRGAPRLPVGRQAQQLALGCADAPQPRHGEQFFSTVQERVARALEDVARRLELE